MVYAVCLVLGAIALSYMRLVAREKRTIRRNEPMLGVVHPKKDHTNNKQKGREIDDEYRK